MSLTRSLLLPSVATSGGRTYYRHSSGMGSVMCWYDVDGTYRETLILDMQYHNVTRFWGARGDDISDITNYTTYPFTGSTYYILGSSSTTPSDYDGQTDDVLNAKFNWIDEHTSEHNTDALVEAYSSSDYAANYCRTKSFPIAGGEDYGDVRCDLPNMQTLVRIFCDRAIIHSLDKSDTNNRWSSWFGGLCVWSSSEYSSSSSWLVYNDGYVDYFNKGSNFYVVPTKNIFVTFITSAKIEDESSIFIPDGNFIGAIYIQLEQSIVDKATYVQCWFLNVWDTVETTITRLDNGVSCTIVTSPQNGHGTTTITQPLVTSSDISSTVNFRITQRILGGNL